MLVPPVRPVILLIGAARPRRVVGRVVHQEGDGAEADDEGQDVEVGDEAGGVEHALPRGLGVGDGEEAHQDVRQAGGAEHQRQAERDGRDRVGHQPARRHDGVAPRMGADGFGEHRLRAEAEMPQHGERHEGRAAQQQAGLDDLHPGGRLHAAEGDVDDHQRADDHHRVEVVEAEQQLDQLPRAHHLRDQVEGDDDERTGRGQDADLRLVEPEGGDVGEGELAEVAQPLRDQEQHDRPADKEADGVDQPVEAGGKDEARDAEEARGRHVVAGDGQPVLEAGDAAARDVEIRRRLAARRRPVGDEERAENEGEEHQDGREVQPLLAAALHRGRRQRNAQGAADGEHGGCGEREREAPAHQTISFVRSRVRSSKRELARWT